MKCVFVFEGQGSTFPGMARQEYEKCEVFRRYFEHISEAIGDDIKDILWGKRRMFIKSDPYNAHVALFSCSYALFQTLLQKGVVPEIVVGHSLGEVIAIVLAGAVKIEDGVKLVIERGKLLRENVKNNSEMIAMIGRRNLLEMALKRIEEEQLGYFANDNSQSQIVISYKKENEKKILEICLELGIRTVILGVSNGCHSVFVKEVEEKLNRVIEGIEFNYPSIKIFSSSFLRELYDPLEIKQFLKKHLLSPVRWRETVDLLTKLYNDYVVVGFSKVMRGLIIENSKDARVFMGTQLLLGG